MDASTPLRRADISKERRMNIETYFNQVYNDTYAEMLKYVIIKTSNADQVEDILQNIYKRFFRRIATKGFTDIRNAQAFLFKLAEKELANHYSSMRIRRENILDVDDFEQAVDAENINFIDVLLDKETLDYIWEIIKTTPLVSYKAFVLFYKYDMAISMIAQQLEITEENVKVRLFRARNAVRKALKGEL